MDDARADDIDVVSPRCFCRRLSRMRGWDILPHEPTRRPVARLARADDVVRGEFIDLDGARLYYYAAGTRGAGEPVVFLHGFPTSGHLWSDVIPLMPAGHRLVVLDLLGYGRSDPPDGRPLTLRAHAERVVALLDALGIAAGLHRRPRSRRWRGAGAGDPLPRRASRASRWSTVSRSPDGRRATCGSRARLLRSTRQACRRVAARRAACRPRARLRRRVARRSLDRPIHRAPSHRTRAAPHSCSICARSMRERRAALAQRLDRDRRADGGDLGRERSLSLAQARPTARGGDSRRHARGRAGRAALHPRGRAASGGGRDRRPARALIARRISAPSRPASSNERCPLELDVPAAARVCAPAPR